MAKRKVATTETSLPADTVAVPGWKRDRRESNYTFMDWFIERYRETLRDLSRS